ncbi:hypothetical protein [Nonomuraea endophytica]|uniref:Excreted virulence factor EspC (Type VII ESX diderm) n=1 Tax=Nonomuraea endophytica TaxID=714136 RepID=A0A7W8ED02_9ACTN|nr:hypothetical protein [Nonomuraea endophytica]MBB5074873.1 hypothetical protein [Nonomuraea endophytica]
MATNSSVNGLAALPQQEVYVTSSAIAHLRSRVDNELAGAVTFVRDLVETTRVDGIGFGPLGGLIMGGAYEDLRDWADSTLGEARGTVDGWSSGLELARRNWRTAEDASKVRYR